MPLKIDTGACKHNTLLITCLKGTLKHGMRDISILRREHYTIGAGPKFYSVCLDKTMKALRCRYICAS